jgi:hypothetical protein
MSLARLLLAGLLLTAPVAPWVAARDSDMECCPLHKARATCCSDSACSIRRCAPPAPLALAALPPCVLPDRAAAIEPTSNGRAPVDSDLSTLSLASDLPDPPPRA